MKAFGLFFVLLLAALPARGADEVARSGEDLLRRTEATYSSLTSFHFAAEEVTETRSGDAERRTSARYVTALEAGGRSRVEIRGPSRNRLAVFDGENSWVYLSSVNQYTRTRWDPKDNFRSKARAFDDDDFVKQVERYPRRYEALSRNLVGATILRRESLDGDVRASAYAVVEASYKLPAGAPLGQSTRTFWIDQKSFLIVREVSRATAEPPVLEHPVEIIQTVLFATARADEELPDSLFVFVPPEDAEQVPTFDRQARRSAQVSRAARARLQPPRPQRENLPPPRSARQDRVAGLLGQLVRSLSHRPPPYRGLARRVHARGTRGARRQWRVGKRWLARLWNSRAIASRPWLTKGTRFLACMGLHSCRPS